MKTFLAGIATGVLLCAACLGQDASPQSGGATTPGATVPSPPTSVQASPGQVSPGSASTAPRIAPGSVIPVRLTKSIDAKKVKTGDPVEAKVTQDMKAGSGEVLIAKDTKVVGHVTEAQARDKERKESQVGITFDHALMNGSDVALPMSIQAVIAPPSLNPDSGPAGAEPVPPASSGTNAGMPQSGGGQPGNMPAGSAQQAPNRSAGEVGQLPRSAGASNANQPVTSNTQGVVGISNLKLAADNTTQGSVLSSEKNNVKLESGTMILLRVNQPQ